MLVSFSVENYRSFAEGQVITMTAGASAKRKKRFSFETENSIAPNLLRSICLFGANGSGKSSLVGAFKFFEYFVISSAKDTQEGEKIDVTSFKLDQEWAGKPTKLEAMFVYDGTLYQYGFAVDSRRVWSEWLYATPNSKDGATRTRNLFQREYDEDSEEYVWKINRTHIIGEKELWKKSTRDNALFLSTAVQLKSDTLRAPFTWIQKYLRIIHSPDRLSQDFTAQKCEKDVVWMKKILNLLNSVDVKISDFDIESKDFDIDKLDEGIISDAFRKEIAEHMKGTKVLNINSIHKDRMGNNVSLDFKEESDGTKVLFSMAGPWFDILENGYVLVVDELHNSLHSNALRFLVNLFHDPEINKNNAQLIFTSHETSVMTKGFMHQDQVWLIEKSDHKNSQLTPLSDFAVRDVARFQKSYLDGRYGAVPKIKELTHV